MSESPAPAASSLVRLREEDLTWQEVGEQVVVLDLRTSRYLEMNASAAVLFRLVAEGSTVEALAAQLQERYELGAERAASDAARFVQHLEEQGLL